MSVTINGTNGITFNDGSLQPSAPVGKNLIINGDMQIAQRGTSSTGITTTGFRTVDRFRTSLSNLGTWTENQSTDAPDEFANSFKLTCTTADASPAAGDVAYIRYMFEGNELQQLAYGTSSAKDMTLSFWVRSNKTGSATVQLLQNDNSSKNISPSYTISSANTWEYKTISIPADTAGNIDNDNGPAVALIWWLNSGSNYSSGTTRTTWTAYSATDSNPANLGVGGATSDYFQITGVQLEANTTATPFENLQYGQQLALCQRYYTNITGGSVSIANCAAWSATTMFGIYNYPTTMRAVPTMTYSALADFDCYMNAVARTPSQFLSENGDENGTRLKMLITGGVLGHAGWYAIDSSGGTLEFSAEL